MIRLSSAAGKLLCGAAGFFMLAPAADGGALAPARCVRAVVRGLAFSGGSLSVSSAGLSLDFGGATSSKAALLSLEARGVEVGFGSGWMDIESFLSSFPVETLLEIPPVELKDCVFFFEDHLPDSNGKAVFFKSLRLSPRDGRLRLEAEDVGFKGVKICRLGADVRLSGDSIEFSSLTGVFAGGEVEASGELNLRSMDASASGALTGVLLEELAPLLPWSPSGTAGLRFDLSGNILSRSVSGGGGASFSGGSITGIPVLPGLAPAFLRAAYTEAVFSEGEAFFSAGRGKIRFERARLSSEDVFLQAAGTIGIDGSLDMMIDASFTEGYMRGRPAPVEVLAHVLRACDFFIIRHRVSGTVREPSYELMPLPLVTAFPLNFKRVLGFLLPMRGRVQP